MAAGFPEYLTRTRYFANYNQGTPNDPNSLTFDPYDPQSVARQGTPVLGDIKVDVEQFLRPLERLHGMGAHGAGIAAGLQVSAAVNQANLQIHPGIALDASGKHIFLAVGGQAELSPDADNYPQPTSNKQPVTAQGVMLPTANLSGDRYVTIQWWEIFDQATWINSNGQVYQFDHTPWLRLLDAAALAQSPYALVVLAKASLDANGKVTVLTYGDPGGTQRSSLSVPAQRVEFRRAVNAAGPLADSVAWGEVRAREGGGLQMSVANSGDQIDIIQGDNGTFAQMNIGADIASFGDPNNPGIVLYNESFIGTNIALCTIGTGGAAGWLFVKDGQDWTTFAVSGDQGSVSVGAPNVPGQVNVVDQSGNTSVQLAGSNGSAVVRRVDPLDGQLIDVGARFLHIHGWDLTLDGRSGNNNRALVDWGDKLIVNFAGDYSQGVETNGDLQVDGVLRDGQGTPLMGNPARKTSAGNPLENLTTSGPQLMFVGSGDWSSDGTVATAEVKFAGPTQFTACVSGVFFRQHVAWGHWGGTCGVEVWQVDGSDTNPWLSGPGLGNPGDDANMHIPVITSRGTTITFRARAMGDTMEFAAYGIVYFE